MVKHILLFSPSGFIMNVWIPMQTTNLQIQYQQKYQLLMCVSGHFSCFGKCYTIGYFDKIQMYYD